MSGCKAGNGGVKSGVETVFFASFDDLGWWLLMTVASTFKPNPSFMGGERC